VSASHASSNFYDTITVSSTVGLYVGQVVTLAGLGVFNGTPSIQQITNATTIRVDTAIGTGSVSASGGTLTASGTQQNLQEWQRTDGTVLTAINPAGGIVTPLATGVVHQTSGGAFTSSTIVDADVSSSAGILASKISGTAYTLTNRTADQYQPSAGLDIFPRMLASAARTSASNSIYLTTFIPMVATDVTNITTYASTGAADSGGTTVRRMALFTVDRTNTQVTMVARTASDSTLWNTTSAVYTRALSTVGGFPATYTLTAGQTYAVGCYTYNTGGTYNAPTIIANPSINTAMNGLSPFIVGIATGASGDIPTTALTVNTNAGNGPWARLT
jgi:hypothetical protein